jgi:hypothetical protein
MAKYPSDLLLTARKSVNSLFKEFTVVIYDYQRDLSSSRAAFFEPRIVQLPEKLMGITF